MPQTPFPAGRWTPGGTHAARYLHALPTPGWVKDAEGRYALVNDAAVALLGRPRTQILGRTDAEILPDAIAQTCVRHDAKARSTGEPMRAIEQFRANDRTVHMVVIRFPIADATETLIGGIAVDVDEHVERENMLRDAVARKREFIATVAHELRNPLAPISTAVTIMQRLGGQTADGLRLLEVIARQTRHLANLVEDLMDASRIATGRMGVRLNAANLTTILRSALEMSRPQIAAAGHELECSLPDQPLPVMADPRRLTQVFSNLLNNAAKFTPRGGTIELTARRSGDMAEVHVKDDGIGIAPEILPKIFDLFAQADTGTDRAHSGLGIGLALVKRLVDLHRGEVLARSAGIGKGCEFEVRLPLLTHAKLTAVSSDDDAVGRFLVIDDDHDAADSLAELLKLMGHEVRVAYDGQSAVAASASFAPTLVLADLEMPGMDGFALAHELRSSLGERPMLVALTGLAGEESRRRSAAAGFDYHLTKPVEVESIEALVAANRSGGK